MILTVTLNPAWDVTYLVDELVVGESHRVGKVSAHAGGKGVNVSRVLCQLGHATSALCVVGGGVGQAIADDLSLAGVPSRLLRIPNESRRTVTVNDANGGATVLNEPGPDAGSSVWPMLLQESRDVFGHADVVVLAGSLPRWAPVDAYRQLVELAHSVDRPCVVDADDAALSACLSAHPDVIKPNRAELARASGESDLTRGAVALRAAGAERVVVSDGAQGMLSFDGVSVWRARPPQVLPLNPTGAGDAAVAAIAVSLAQNDAPEASLRRACAWSAAAVLSPRAGLVDSAALDEISARIELTRLSGT